MKKIILLFLLSSLFACNHLSSSDDDNDPLETVNRSVFDFNRTLDETVLQPTVSGYQTVMPDYAQARVHDFFKNLVDVKTMFNQALQGKIVDAFGTFGRVALNSTVGVFGLYDVASDLKITRKHEDFGQTLATWGVPSGPYVVLPLFGPSTLRDTVGLVGDNQTQVDMTSRLTNNEQWFAKGLDVIDKRIQYDTLIESIYRKSDPYSFAKESYLQKRQFDISDGAVAIEDDDF